MVSQILESNVGILGFLPVQASRCHMTTRVFFFLSNRVQKVYPNLDNSTLPMVYVHITGSYSGLGTLFAPKTFGMHTNFYGVYLGYEYKILVCFTSGF